MKETDLSALEQTIEKYPWYSLAHLEFFKRMNELGEDHRNAYLRKAAAYLYSREALYDMAFPKSDYTSGESDAEHDSFDLSQESVSLEPEAHVDAYTDNVVELIPDEPAAASTTVIHTPPEEEDDFFEFIPDTDDEPVTEQRVVFAGGDYFSRIELETLELDREKPLDKFIVEKPSLLRATTTSSPKGDSPYIKDGDPSPAEIDTSEMFEDAGFYTETLAKIYTEQGFYKRALDVYAKLILLYPEKSVYFASLVKELKTKHNT